MKEVQGDAWKLKSEYTYLVITTNGFVKSSGAAVMGRGIALQAKNKYSGIEYLLGQMITDSGNIVQKILPDIISFPVKHNWWEKADIELIKSSCIQLLELIGENETVLLPKPGCGNGGLRWEDVKIEVEKILDDRFTIISY